jgi:hypothetical protein
LLTEVTEITVKNTLITKAAHVRQREMGSDGQDLPYKLCCCQSGRYRKR